MLELPIEIALEPPLYILLAKKRVILIRRCILSVYLHIVLFVLNINCSRDCLYSKNTFANILSNRFKSKLEFMFPCLKNILTVNLPESILYKEWGVSWLHDFDPPVLTWVKLNPCMDNNLYSSKSVGRIIYPIPNFKGCTVEVWNR